MAWQRFALSKDSTAAAEKERAACARQEVERLRLAVARIEDRCGIVQSPAEAACSTHRRRVPLGVAQIDAALGGGLAAGALHEVRAETALDLPGAAGFALAAAGLLTDFDSHVFWIAPDQVRCEAGSFYGPGLYGFGLDPARLVRVLVRNDAQALWAAGEVTAAAGAGVCLIELRGNPAAADLAFSRRLALRARVSQVSVILLRQSGKAQPSAALTRWRISPAPSHDMAQNSRQQGQWAWVGMPTWKVELEKCRGGRPGEWTLEWKSDGSLFVPCPGRSPLGPRTPLSGGQSAFSGDRPDRAAALGSGLALERVS